MRGDTAPQPDHEPADRPADDPVEVYLDELLVSLPGPPREVRHTLAEVEAHLHDASAAAIADGVDPLAARAMAVRQLGPVSGVADRSWTRLWRSVGARRRVTLAFLLVSGVAGLAIGVAGIMGRIVQAGWGTRAIGVPFPPGSYTPADCARWRAGYPAASSCVAAMTADHADDFLRNAVLGGLLGLLALVGYLVLRHRWGAASASTGVLPRGAEEILGAVLAIGVAALLAGQGVDAVLVTQGNGSGQSFSLAAAALLAATFFVVRARVVSRTTR